MTVQSYIFFANNNRFRITFYKLLDENVTAMRMRDNFCSPHGYTPLPPFQDKKIASKEDF